MYGGHRSNLESEGTHRAGSAATLTPQSAEQDKYNVNHAYQHLGR